MGNEPGPAPELYVQLGVLDAEKLKRCLEFQATFEKQGLSLPLSHVILNLGMAKPEQVLRGDDRRLDQLRSAGRPLS